ncbi:hypothetical protein Taro_047027 [Colocasia esculenta]|uniref:Uncharacterized protein n=1 Tax=Colocasia esculenta TaxID=4460 RepID=A0A843X7R0_COLES|nr:hypothetical protein [Colocasia esculenta]
MRGCGMAGLAEEKIMYAGRISGGSLGSRSCKPSPTASFPSRSRRSVGAAGGGAVTGDSNGDLVSAYAHVGTQASLQRLWRCVVEFFLVVIQ